MRLEEIFTAEELLLIDSGQYLPGREVLDAKLDLSSAIEREACAKVCDDKHHTWRWDEKPDSASGPRDCAAAIRARVNK